MDHYNLSHHGRDPEKLKQLRTVEAETVKVLRDLPANRFGSSTGTLTGLEQVG